jgi:hypothetical protein
MKKKLYTVTRNCYVGRIFFTAGYQVALTDEEAESELEAGKITSLEADDDKSGGTDTSGDEETSNTAQTGDENPDTLSPAEKRAITRARNKAIKTAKETIEAVNNFLTGDGTNLSDTQTAMVTGPLKDLEASVAGKPEDVNTEDVESALAALDIAKAKLTEELEGNGG